MPGREPSFVNTSLWQIPHACTLMRTCPGLGLGISRSMIWKSAPGLGTCATFIVATETVIVAIQPPPLAAEATNHLLTTPRNAPCDSDLNRQLKKSWNPRPSSRFCFLDLVGPFFQNDSNTEAVQVSKVSMVSRKLRRMRPTRSCRDCQVVGKSVNRRSEIPA